MPCRRVAPPLKACQVSDLFPRDLCLPQRAQDHVGMRHLLAVGPLAPQTVQGIFCGQTVSLRYPYHRLTGSGEFRLQVEAFIVLKPVCEASHCCLEVCEPKHITSSSGMTVTQTSCTMRAQPASWRTAASNTHTCSPAKRSHGVCVCVFVYT